ncbi:MAG: bacteriohemerythrin [Bryobacterales bacterium]|nr:bacteriohemerythrin [Bryobacterales bacterium]
MLEWKGDYSVGVERLDAQHRKLFDYFNELEGAMRKGRGRDVIGQVLANLASYTREHFRQEEELMRRVAFPALERHRQAHEAFVARVQELVRRQAEGDTSVTVEAAHSLADWLSKHILGMDREYAPYMAKAKVA